MNKKLLLVFFAVLLCVVVSVPAFADTAEDYTPHLIDNADLLTGEEEVICSRSLMRSATG